MSRTPLLLPALFWLAGLFAGFFGYTEITFRYYFQIILPLIVCLTAGYFIFKHQAGKFLLLMMLVFLLAYLRASVTQRKPAHHISNIWGEHHQVVQPVMMKITSFPQKREGTYGNYYRVSGKIEQLASAKINGNIILSFPVNYLIDNPQQLFPGNYLKTTARMSKFRHMQGFSKIPAAYFRSSQATDVSGFAVTTVEIVDEQPGQTPFLKRINREYYKSIHTIRTFLIDRIETRIPPNHLPFIKAILLGDRSGVQEERDILAEAGMAHLLAISGLHLSIITLVIITLLSLFYIRRTPANLITIVIILIYAEICGWTPSISRAAVMIILFLITKILQRKPSANNVLLTGLILITAINPAQIFSIGLQFSFISVFVIINIYPLFRDNQLPPQPGETFIVRQGKLTAKHLFNIMILSFFISIFLSPLLLYYFNQFSLNGIIANLAGIPLLTIIIPLSLVVIIFPDLSLPLRLQPFFTFLFSWSQNMLDGIEQLSLVNIYGSSLTFVMDLFNRWTQITSSLPFFFNFIPFSFLQVTACYALLIFLFIIISRHLRFKKISKGVIKDLSSYKVKRIPANKLSVFCQAAFVLLLVVIIISPSLISPGDLLKITMFDVGHGDLFLVETPASQTILIDTGPLPDTRGHIRYSALPYLRQKGIRNIDWLIITHPHSDHYGGFSWAMNNLQVDNIVITEHFKQSPVWDDLAAEAGNSNIFTVEDTTHIKNISLDNKIIHPDSSYYSDIVNNMSLVMKLQHHNFSMLFTGDIELDAEVYLVNNYSSYLSSIALKVPHHGSDTSSSELFLNTVDARYFFVPSPPVGIRDFPSEKVLQRLSDRPGNKTFVSGETGATQIKTDGFTATIISFPQRSKIAVNF